MRRRIIPRNMLWMWREHKSALALLLFATARNLEIRESVIFIRFQESLTSGAPAKRFYRFSTRSTPPVLPNPLLYNTGGIYYAYHRTTYFRPDLTVKTRRLPELHISPTIMSLFLNNKFCCSFRNSANRKYSARHRMIERQWTTIVFIHYIFL